MFRIFVNGKDEVAMSQDESLYVTLAWILYQARQIKEHKTMQKASSTPIDLVK